MNTKQPQTHLASVHQQFRGLLWPVPHHVGGGGEEPHKIEINSAIIDVSGRAVWFLHGSLLC